VLCKNGEKTIKNSRNRRGKRGEKINQIGTGKPLKCHTPNGLKPTRRNIRTRLLRAREQLGEKGDRTEFQKKGEARIGGQVG